MAWTIEDATNYIVGNPQILEQFYAEDPARRNAVTNDDVLSFVSRISPGGPPGSSGDGLGAIVPPTSTPPPTTTTPPPMTSQPPPTTTTTPPPVSIPPPTTGGGFGGLVGTTPTTPNIPSSTVPGPATRATFVQQYLAARPDLQNNWNADPGYATTYGTLEDYILADAAANGTSEQKSAAQGWIANPTGQPGGSGGVTVPQVGDQNFQQQQNAAQTGSFQTNNQQNFGTNQTSGQQTNQQQTGSTATQQTGATAQNTNQQQTSGSTGATSQNTTGTTTQSGTSTVAPVDTLGFGALLRDQAGQVGTTDASRAGFLTDVMQTGGEGFNSQVEQAVRRSLSGPQITGAGDSARARAAGYAGADVARHNLGQRLEAAGQLAGPTGLATLSTAANPYVGQTSTNAGTSNTSGSTTGTQNLTGFQNLVGSTTGTSSSNTLQDSVNNLNSTTGGFQNIVGAANEATGGTATGSSSQAAAGKVPEAQQIQTGGGGCVLCTAATELGLHKELRSLRRVISYKLSHPRFLSAARGYFFLFTPVARYLLARPRLAAILYPMARAVVYEELRVSGRRLPLRVWASFVHWTGHALCSLVGKLPVPGRVTDPVIERIARKHKIWFSL